MLVNRKGLIGRKEELAKLTGWVASPLDADLARIFCIVAIGGTGKSALTWHWSSELSKALTQTSNGFSGCVWWSFYELGSTYQKFILHTLSYVSGIPTKQLAEEPLSTCEDNLLHVLSRTPYLLVLDGLERILNAYADPATIYQRDDDLSEFERSVRPRLTIDPNAGRFLRRLAKADASRILISSRLYPAVLEDLTGQPIKGSDRLDLLGLKDDDSLAFWGSFGLSGTDSLLLSYFATFERHPLLIQALASIVARDRRANCNFDTWVLLHPNFNIFALPIKQVRSHILELAMQGLSEREFYTLHVIAGVRSPISFETLVSLLIGSDSRQFLNESELIETLELLEQTGLLGWDNRPGVNRYDLHPIVRGVAWSRLGPAEKDGIFERLQQHFEAIPTKPPHEIVSIEDLSPAIELFHALASRGHSEQAHNVFEQQLMKQLDRIGAATTYLGLLQQLFPNGWDSEPGVTDARCLFQRLCDKFATIGDLNQAIKMHARHNEICDKPACRLTDVYFLNVTGKLNAAIDELTTMSTSLFAAASNKNRLNEIFSPLIRTLIYYADITDECGDIQTSQLIDRTISRILWERWNSTDNIFAQYFHHSSIDEVAYLYNRAMRYKRYRIASNQADRLWRLVETQGSVGHRINASLMQAASRLKLGDLATAKDRLDYSRRHAKAAGYLSEEIVASRMLAELELEWGNLESAFAALEDIWELFDRAPYRLLHAESMNVMAAIYIAAGDPDSAGVSARQAYNLALCDGPPYSYHQELLKAIQHFVHLNTPDAVRLQESIGLSRPHLKINLSLPSEFWEAVRADRVQREII